MRIRSDRSPSVRLSQFDVKPAPVSGGVMSSPSRSRPWQLEHSSINTACPRFACSSLKTPSQVERGDCAKERGSNHKRHRRIVFVPFVPLVVTPLLAFIYLTS